MKKIDRLLTHSFVGPFIATFFIAMFVLIMQFLWTYIDDIIGKGVGLWMITELLFYLSMSLIPTALPIAILISSVMVLGNLAEHYELSSFKSAGVPLLRVMLPLIILTSGIGLFSFFCSNNLIPVTNLKFKSRLYDIRKSKPTLSLEQGIFNEDFKGFVIHIGEKEADERTIRDVIIYNHDHNYKDRISIITAKRGEMYNSDDKQFFIMNLYDGIQYQEPKTDKKDKEDKRPFVRTYFKEWNKVFDLSEFDVQNTDEDRFRNNHTMLTTTQLRAAIDSIDRKIERRMTAMSNHLFRHFQPTKSFVKALAKEDERYINANKRKADLKKSKTENKPAKTTSVKTPQSPIISTPAKKTTTPKKKQDNKKTTKAASPTPSKKKTGVSKKNQKNKKANPPPKKLSIPIQPPLNKPLMEYNSFIETLSGSKRTRYFNKAKSFARGIRDQAEGAHSSLDRTHDIRVKHVYELNMKFSMAVVCLIFLFIGGPMGAIIRKGGFGYPILVAIFFFVVFMILNIFCKKLAESAVLPALFASWVPCMILAPVGMILTYRAMNDSKVINFDRLERILNFLLRKKKAT